MSGTKFLSIFLSILLSMLRSQSIRVSALLFFIGFGAFSPYRAWAQAGGGSNDGADNPGSGRPTHPSHPPRTSLPPGAVHSPFAVGVGAVAAQVVAGAAPQLHPAGRTPEGHIQAAALPGACNAALAGSDGAVPLVTVRRHVVVLTGSGNPGPAVVPAPVAPRAASAAQESSQIPTVIVEGGVPEPVTIPPSPNATPEVVRPAASPVPVDRPPQPTNPERGLVRLTAEAGALVVARLNEVSIQVRGASPTTLHRVAQERFDAGGSGTAQPLYGAETTSPERRVALDLAHRILQVLASNPKLGAFIHLFEPRATVGQFESLVVLAVSEPDATGNFELTGVLPNGVVKTFSSQRLASLTPEVAGQFLVGPFRLDLARLDGEALERFQEIARTAKAAAGGWVRSSDTVGQRWVAMLPTNPFLLLPPQIRHPSGRGVPPQVAATVGYLMDLARGAPAKPPGFSSVPGIIYTKAISPPRHPILTSSGQGPTLTHPWEVRTSVATDGVWSSKVLQGLIPIDPAVLTPSDASEENSIPPPRTYQVGAMNAPGNAQALAQLVARAVSESGQELELVVRVLRSPVTPSTSGGPSTRPFYDRAVVRGQLEQVRPGPNGVVESIVVIDTSGRRHVITAADLLYLQPQVAGQVLPPIPLSAVVAAWPNGVSGPAGHQIHSVNRDWFNAAMAAYASGAVVRVRITDPAQFPGQILVAGQAAGVTGQYNTSANSSGPRRPVRGVGAFEAAYSYLTGEAPRSRPAQNSVRPDAVTSAVEFSAVVAGAFWDVRGKWFVHLRELPPASGESARTVGLVAAPLDEALAVSVTRLNPDRVLLVPGESTSTTTFGFRPNGLGAQEAIATIRARVGQVVFWGNTGDRTIEGQITGFIEMPPLQGVSVTYRIYFKPIVSLDPRGEFVFGPVVSRDFLAARLSQIVPLKTEAGSWRDQRTQRLQDLGLLQPPGEAPANRNAAPNVATYGGPVEFKVALLSRAISRGAPVRVLFPAASGGQWFQYEGYPSRSIVERAADGQVYVHVAFEGPAQLTRIAADNTVVDSRQLSPDSAEVRIPEGRLQAGHVQILPINSRTGAASRP